MANIEGRIKTEDIFKFSMARALKKYDLFYSYVLSDLKNCHFFLIDGFLLCHPLAHFSFLIMCKSLCQYLAYICKMNSYLTKSPYNLCTSILCSTAVHTNHNDWRSSSSQLCIIFGFVRSGMFQNILNISSPNYYLKCWLVYHNADKFGTQELEKHAMPLVGYMGFVLC